MSDELGTPGETFWEKHYRGLSGRTGGRPGAALVRFARDRRPGRALDLGCARGDDVVWLASLGWEAVGADVSATALERARENAERAGVADRATFERHDLSRSLPEGRFDLVSATFLHSPVALSRADVLRRAAASVAPGGLLLSVTHASTAPWSWADPDTVWPTPEEELDGIGLSMTDWHRIAVEAVRREATGPEGRKATVTDNVVALERRGPSGATRARNG